MNIGIDMGGSHIAVGVVDNKKVLNNFSLDIDDGNIHVIMGPNGTGKSTLSKAIMGHYKFDVVSGNIINNEELITIITNKGTGKRVRLTEFEKTSRARKGVLVVRDVKTNPYYILKTFILNSKNETSKDLLTILNFQATSPSSLKLLKFTPRKIFFDIFILGLKKTTKDIQMEINVLKIPNSSSKIVVFIIQFIFSQISTILDYL